MILGVDVFFTWGVIEKEGRNHLALIAGGWNDALVVDEYLELMYTYTRMLIQAEQESVAVDLQFEDEEMENLGPHNTTISIVYDEDYNEIEDIEDLEETRESDEAVTKRVQESLLLSALANMTQSYETNFSKER